MKKLLLSLPILLLASNVMAANLDATLSATAYNAVGLVNNPVYCQSRNDASVTNNTDTIQEIHVSYRLCADGQACSGGRNYTIKINPHANWHDGVDMQISPTYRYRGAFALTATVSVTGSGLNKTFFDNATIQVR